VIIIKKGGNGYLGVISLEEFVPVACSRGRRGNYMKGYKVSKIEGREKPKGGCLKKSYQEIKKAASVARLVGQ